MGRTTDRDWRAGAVLRRGGVAAVLEAVSSAIALAVLVAVETLVGTDALGTYGVASAWGVLLLVPSTLGLSQIVIRRGAVDAHDFRALCAASLHLRLLYLVAVTPFALWLSPDTAFGLLVLSAAANTLLDLSTAVLRALERYVAAGLVGVVYRSASVVAVLAFAARDRLTPSALALLTVTVTTGLASVWWSFRAAGVPVGAAGVRPLHPVLRRYAREGAALMLYQAGYGLTVRLDLVLLGALAGVDDASSYVAAAVISAGLANVSFSIVGLVLPRLAAVPPAALAKEARRIAVVAVLAIAACTVVALPFVSPVVDAVYGSSPRLADTAGILRLLLLGFPFLVGARVLLAGLVAGVRPWRVAAIQGAGVLWLGVGVLVGYSIAGTTGVAVASTSADAWMFVLAVAATRSWTPDVTRAPAPALTPFGQP